MISEFKDSDMDRVLDIWLCASIKSHDFIKPEFWNQNILNMRDSYIPASTTYLFTKDDLILGFISMCNEIIAALFVDLAYQNKGIGTALLNYVKQHNDFLLLTVYKLNIKSIKFYQNNGFQIVEEQIDEMTGKLELVMEWYR